MHPSQPLSMILFVFVLLHPGALPACRIEPGPWPPGPIMPGPPPPIPEPTLQTRSHHADITVHGEIVTVHVDAVFHNPGSAQREGTYWFPIAEHAAVRDFTMTVNGRAMASELLSSDKARRMYEDIVRRRRDPALLEYMNGGMLKARVFPIPAHGSVKISLEYSYAIQGEGGVYRLRYPLGSAKPHSGSIGKIVCRVRLLPSSPLKTVYSPSHQLAIDRRGDQEAIMTYEAADVIPDKDLVLYYTASPGDLLASVIAYDTPADDPYFMLMITPKLELDTGETMPKDVIIVMDTSGSMAGEKIENARRALAYCVNSLDAKDRFNLVPFSSGIHPFRPALVPASMENRRAALDFIGHLHAAGGTAIHDALHSAIRMFDETPISPDPALHGASGRDPTLCRECAQKVFTDDVGSCTVCGRFTSSGMLRLCSHCAIQQRRCAACGVRFATSAAEPSERPAAPLPGPATLIFITDGLPTIGETDIQRILESVKNQDASRKIRIFPFGVGTDVHTDLLDKLAEQNHGDCNYVMGGENLEDEVSRFYAKIAHPVFTDVTLSLDGWNTYDMYPRTLPDIFKGTQLLITGRIRGRARNGAVTLQGNWRGRPRTFRFPIHAGESRDAAFLPRLWAIRKVGYLLEAIRLRGKRRELVDEIVALGKRHGIVTPYTSFLIVEESELAANAPLRERMQGCALRFETRRKGDEAVSASAFMQAMKESSVPSSPGNRVSGFAGGLLQDRVLRDTGRVETVHIADKTFYKRNDGYLYDSLYDRKNMQEAVVIRLFSDEYFSLIRTHPVTARYLKGGRKIVLVFEGEVYRME